MCGFVGVKGVQKAAELAVVGAHVLQNRARTYAGGISCDGQYFYRYSAEGLARQVFSGKVLDRLHGRDALVHLRYPTTNDQEDRDNTQPIEGIYAGKPIAIGHNGNLTNTQELRALLPPDFKMKTSLDTEYVLRLLEYWQTGNLENDLQKVFSHLKGSYTLAVLTPEKLIGVRDKSGNRPLSLGKLDGGYCIASENSAFANMEAKFVQDIDSGTMVIIDDKHCRVERFAPPEEKKCPFELLYNGSQASRIFGIDTATFRERIGEVLAKLYPVPDAIDVIVTPIPDSGNFYAAGFAKNGVSGIWREVIFRNHYVGRTFNAASQALRDEEVSRKFIFAENLIAGKRILVLDDSVVRGTTLPKIIEMLWKLGAKEVHVRIGTPEIKKICYYGIYMDEDETDLISGKNSPDQLAVLVSATSLAFLSLSELKGMLPEPSKWCFACMGDPYWD